jgi:hypothetical protein
MSGVEGAEREDYDEREAGVGDGRSFACRFGFRIEPGQPVSFLSASRSVKKIPHLQGCSVVGHVWRSLRCREARRFEAGDAHDRRDDGA